MRKLVNWMLLMVGLCVLSPVWAWGHGGRDLVYVMSNAAKGNSVLVFDRDDDGALIRVGEYRTGGKGSGPGETVPVDPLGSQSSLLLSDDGRWLFAVNAGSNTVSSFRVFRNRLYLTDVAYSGGKYPVSLALSFNLLYVLNAAEDGSIVAFAVDHRGHLLRVPDGKRSLHAGTPYNGAQPNILESPAQVEFSPDGDWLVVSDKGGVSGQGRIHVFAIGRDGLPSRHPVTTDVDEPVPFAVAFDRRGHLLVTGAGGGALYSYAIGDDGGLRLLSTAANGQAATCWIALTRRYAYTANTGSGTLTGYRPGRDGSLQLLDRDGVTANVGPDALPIDLAVTGDQRFLYTINGGEGSVGVWRIDHRGRLTSAGSLPAFTALDGVQGIAAQ